MSESSDDMTEEDTRQKVQKNDDSGGEMDLLEDLNDDDMKKNSKTIKPRKRIKVDKKLNKAKASSKQEPTSNNKNNGTSNSIKATKTIFFKSPTFDRSPNYRENSLSPKFERDNSRSPLSSEEQTLELTETFNINKDTNLNLRGKTIIMNSNDNSPFNSPRLHTTEISRKGTIYIEQKSPRRDDSLLDAPTQCLSDDLNDTTLSSDKMKSTLRGK